MSSKNVSREQQVTEIVKCGKDPVHFLKTYVKIQHPLKGLIPFETYEFQDDCLKQFAENRFNIVLKSRQLGLSTICAGYALWLALFYKEKNVLVIATKLSTAINFIKKVQVMFDSVPKWLLLCKAEPTKQTITFSNGSTIKAIPTSEDAGRSEALSLLIVDEAAFIKNFETIWTSIYPTLTLGGSAIILSTPNGVGGQYYKLWTEAEAGANAFNTIKLPWYVHPEHDNDWFKEETKNLSQRKISQEYLCDFISSGETFLQSSEMDYLRSLITVGEKSDIDRNLWIWQDPLPNHKYVVSADISRGDSKDFSASHVVDVEEGNVVAEFLGKIPPDKFADLLIKIGKKYNEALIVPENNSYGWTTAMNIKNSGYSRLYHDKIRGNPFDPRNMIMPDDAKPGFSTQTQSRQNILLRLEELIRNKHLTCYSQRTYDQLQAFVWTGHKAQALRDSHDDLVISLAIAAWFIEGVSVPNEKKAQLDLQLMKSTKIVKHGTEHIFKDVNAVAPVGKVVQQILKTSPLKPVEHDKISKGLNIDFSWLLK